MEDNDQILSETNAPVILIVEDTSITLKVITTILSKERYKIETAANGAQALDAVRKVLPDVILLDIVMPGMDGYEVCRILKESPETMDVPVIFITVKDEMENMLKGFEAGAVDYVTKPFNSAELLARVRTHVELKKKRDNEKELIFKLKATLDERNKAEDALQQAHDNLERLVAERTSELLLKNRQLVDEIARRKLIEEALKNRERELKDQSRNLKELNNSMKALVKMREKDKEEFEDWVLSNVKKLILPNIEKLNKTSLDARGVNYVSILESNVNDILSSFSQRLSSKFLNLTSKEIQVANLVKDGMGSRKISQLMDTSVRTIDFHRNNIRKKLGLQDKKVNLRSFLLHMPE
jgi:DNA-binding response OmpR family regulator/DNA-binding CsgD family transcriptional regulator